MSDDTHDLVEAIHPGIVLHNKFMKPNGLSINRLARDLVVPPNRIHAIIHGERSVTADTALRLAAYFDIAAESWLGLQIDYDLRVARHRHGDKILHRVRRLEI